MTGLTRRMAAAITFIDRHIAEAGYSPSYDEIAAGIGYSSKGTAHTMVSSLVERGYLRRRNDRGRTLEVIRRPPGADAPLPGPAALSRASDDALHQLRRDLAMEITRRTNDRALAEVDTHKTDARA